MVLEVYKPFHVNIFALANLYKVVSPYICMDKTLEQTREKLFEIDNEEPKFKNYCSYIGKDWRKAADCTVYPAQRRLTRRECVFDFDNISALQMLSICQWMKSSDFKFEAWMSSPKGIHVHFWTDITGLNRKKILTEVMSEKIKELFKVENDIGPMSQNMIRTEGANHPTKGHKKILFMSNLSTLFPINDINSSVREKVQSLGLISAPNEVSNSGLSHGRCRTCMKTILDGTFTDCRKRLMFTVASHYIAVGLDKKEAAEKTWEWAKRQGGIHYNDVYASVHSSSGKVGCYTRHKLLEEVGIDATDCRWEK